MTRHENSRLNKVLKLLSSGLTPSEVCSRLGMSNDELQRYLLDIQKISSEWLDFLSTSGYHIAYKKNLQDLLYNRERLYSILKRIDKKLGKNPTEAKTGYLEVQILAQIDKNIALHWELQNGTPMVDSFNKFVQEKVVGVPGKDHLPFLPSDD